MRGGLCTAANSEFRLAPPIAIAASLVLHATIIAAVLFGPGNHAPTTEPEPLIVALVMESGGTAGGSGTRESGAARSDKGGSPGSVQAHTEASPAVATTEPARVMARTPAAKPLGAPPSARPPVPEVVRKRPAAVTESRPPPRHLAPPEPMPEPATRADEVSPTPEPLREPAHTDSAASAAQPPSGTAGASGIAGADGVASFGMADGNSAGGEASSPGTGDGGSGKTRRGGASGRGPTRGPGYSLGSAANPMPVYPSAARRKGIEGTVILEVQVSANGWALAVDVARSSGSALLDDAAREAIARWRFRAAQRNGEAIAANVVIPVQFTLRDG